MRIRLDDIRAGLHPGEAVATIQTMSGPEELIISERSAQEKFVEVGSPVGRSEEYYLVELPSETSWGAWRVWIKKDVVVEGALKAAE
jgi:hypothetical protein